jgi:hypothetical protein
VPYHGASLTGLDIFTYYVNPSREMTSNNTYGEIEKIIIPMGEIEKIIIAARSRKKWCLP